MSFTNGTLSVPRSYPVKNGTDEMWVAKVLGFPDRKYHPVNCPLLRTCKKGTDAIGVAKAICFPIGQAYGFEVGCQSLMFHSLGKAHLHFYFLFVVYFHAGISLSQRRSHKIR